MAKFELAFYSTLGQEGFYSDSPLDRGGETWRGISRKNFPNWKGWPIIDAIKQKTTLVKLTPELMQSELLLELVKKFYLDTFWQPLGLWDIKQQVIADELFDTAINQGKQTAVKYLQESLNLLNNNGRHYSEIKVDGYLGNKTLKALDAYMFTAVISGRSVIRNTRTLLKAMNGLQFQKYLKICQNEPKQEVHMYGWLNRV